MGSKNIKQPVKNGVAKVPVIMQLEALECAAASLAMLMAYYDKWVPLEQVREDCGVSRDGSKAKNIALAAMHYGFEAQAFRYSPEAIQKEASFPCIIHWNMNHFVVLNGFKGNQAYLNDPARGDVAVTMEEFDESFTGVTIIPTPGPDFEPSGKQKSTLEFAKKRLVGAGAAVAFVMITTALGYLFGIINSFTSRIFMDRLLTGVNLDWVDPFMALMLLLAVLQIIVAWAQAVYSLKINGKMAVIGSTSFMWKVLRLPVSFFSQRQAGDIQNRLALNAPIAGTLVNTLALLLLNTAMAVFYLAVMINQSVPLTCIGLGALVINIAVSRYISKQRVNITRVQMRDQAKLASTKASSIEMIETIKSSGAENGFFQRWAGYQASVNAQTVKVNKTNMLVGKIPLLLTDIANYGVLVLGVYLTMQGEYTLGGVMMFQGFLSSIMQPAQQLVEAGQTVQEMRTQMERVEDVMEYPEDSISANIKMWDSTIEDFEVIMAAHDAQLHDDITKLPDGYLHKLTSGGKNLSGGQRQRMEIARVLVQDPTIVIMDEATSAPDARTEHEVVNAIHERGITCIVIAHRLSTVRDCDEIIVLDRGKVVERGTHDELMAKNGAYAELVASE